jgi:hypothetical protein
LLIVISGLHAVTFEGGAAVAEAAAEQSQAGVTTTAEVISPVGTTATVSACRTAVAGTVGKIPVVEAQFLTFL